MGSDSPAFDFGGQPTCQAIREQNCKNRTVGKRAPEVCFYQPDEVDYASRGTEVDQPVKPLPAFSSQATDPAGSRS